MGVVFSCLLSALDQQYDTTTRLDSSEPRGSSWCGRKLSLSKIAHLIHTRLHILKQILPLHTICSWLIQEVRTGHGIHGRDPPIRQASWLTDSLVHKNCHADNCSTLHGCFFNSYLCQYTGFTGLTFKNSLAYHIWLYNILYNHAISSNNIIYIF